MGTYVNYRGGALEKNSNGRKKKDRNPSAEFITKLCELYSEDSEDHKEFCVSHEVWQV